MSSDTSVPSITVSSISLPNLSRPSVEQAPGPGPDHGSRSASAPASEFRSSPPSREAGPGRRPPLRPGVVALIDAEFWRWWQETPKGAPERDVLIAARQAVRDALMQTRDGLQLQRLLWVGETRVPGLDDVRVVVVPGTDHDEGWPLVRALSQALFDVAQGGIVHTVLLATDDDRLLPAIDEVQRRGLRVLMLQGEENRLSDEWRRLLASADRCLPVGESRSIRTARADRDRPEGARPEALAFARADDTPTEPPTAEVLQTLHEAAAQWWSGLDDFSRQSLRDALPHSRGLPRDLDRQLLISAARTLERQLSVPEKHALRGAARTTASQRPDSVASESSDQEISV